MKTIGKASWLKITGKVLGCALQKMNSGINTRRDTDIAGKIHLGDVFLGCENKPRHFFIKQFSNRAGKGG